MELVLKPRYFNVKSSALEDKDTKNMLWMLAQEKVRDGPSWQEARGSRLDNAQDLSCIRAM